jgi:hypothetical protein
MSWPTWTLLAKDCRHHKQQAAVIKNIYMVGNSHHVYKDHQPAMPGAEIAISSCNEQVGKYVM